MLEDGKVATRDQMDGPSPLEQERKSRVGHRKAMCEGWGGGNRGSVNQQGHSRVPALDRRQELPGPTATACAKSLECSWHTDLVKVSVPLAWGPPVYSLHCNFSAEQICFFNIQHVWISQLLCGRQQLCLCLQTTCRLLPITSCCPQGEFLTSLQWCLKLLMIWPLLTALVLSVPSWPCTLQCSHTELPGIFQKNSTPAWRAFSHLPH